MKKIKFILKSFFSILLVIYCYLQFNKSLDIEENYIQNIIFSISSGWYYVILSISMLILSVHLRSLRWQKLFIDQLNINIFDLSRFQYIGYFINNIAPIRVGDIMRSYYVSTKTKHKTSFIFGTIVMERLLDFLMVILMLIILSFIYPIYYFQFQTYDMRLSFQIIGFTIIIFAIIIYYFLFKSNLLFAHSIKNIILNVYNGFISIRYAEKKSILITTLLIWTIYWLNVFIIKNIFTHLNLNLLDCLLILVVSSFLQMIPVGFG